MLNDDLAGFYLDKIKASEKPAEILYEFYIRLYNKNQSESLKRIFIKLVKLYGRIRVYFAILFTYDVEGFTSDVPYPMLVWFIKRELAKNTSYQEYIDMDEVYKKLKKVVDKKIKIHDPFKYEASK
jgi:membrane protein required for beta-lactamase induction